MRFTLGLCMLLFIYGCGNKQKKDAQKLEKNSIEIVNFNGFEKYLNQEDDKVYVINFWATWCKPCIEEMPYLLKLQEEKNVELILVSLDFPKMKDSHLKPFLEKRKIDAKVVLLDDPNSNVWIPKVNPDWGGAIPATLIYKNEKSQFYARPFVNYDELITEVKKMM